MMGRYIQEANHETAMNAWVEGHNQEPLVHTIYTLDFMALGKHNIACPVCFDAPATLERNITPGKWDQKAQPCNSCQSKGWRTRLPWWRQLFK